jgi:hypothetical protein
LAFKKSLTLTNICKVFLAMGILAFESKCNDKQDATI